MQLLISGNIIIAVAPKIQFGVFDEAIEKWALLDEQDNVMMYYLDDNFNKVENVEVPSDFAEGKYFYENGGFVLNENWQEPLPSAEERISVLEEQILIADETAVELYEAQSVQEEINMAQDEAIIEIYEMLGGM